MSGKVLVAVAYGRPFALLLECATEDFATWMADWGACGDGFDFEDNGIDYNASLADGIWIGDLKAYDDGPGDWPGTREYVPQFTNERPATAEEWRAYCSGELPWESISEAQQK